jgi:WD40 repeat protein/serine/threonine protein kinase
LDEQLQALLAKYDEALAAGQPLAPLPIDAFPSELQSDLKSLVACVLRLEHDRLRRVRPLLAPLAAGSVPPQASPTVHPDFAPQAQTQEESPAERMGEERSAPVQLGPFRIVRVLGTGGFGVVYLAEDTRLGRQVALKVPRSEALVTPQLRKRFLREAHAAARLHHTNIVPIFEVGEAGPLCYIISAFCPGGTLAHWLKNRRAPVPFRVAANLTAVLADGVQHAHDRGILHRDLKPGNVVLRPEENTAATGPDGFGFTPLITDFGLAKFVDLAAELSPPPSRPAPRTPDSTTAFSQILTHGAVGTPGYMAPEQAAGVPEAVGTAADVYSLGAILYHLLTGQPPLTDDAGDVLVRVGEEQPVAPRHLRTGISRDLEIICLKCLRKHPGERYISARDLANDLRRWMAGEPVRARPAGPLRRVAKWIRRRPAAAGFIMLSLVTAISLAGGALWYTLARAQEERQQKRATYVRQIGQAHRSLEKGELDGLTELLNGLRPAPGDQDLRGFEWYYLWRQYQEAGIRLGGHERAITGVAFSRDGRTLVSSGLEGTLRLWDPRTGQPQAIIPGRGGVVLRMAISPNAELLATVDDDGNAALWDAARKRLAGTLTGAGGRQCMAFSPASDTLASGAGDTVLFWDLATKRIKARLLHGSEVRTIAFAPDGKMMASAELRGPIRLWDAQTGQNLAEVLDPGCQVAEVTFSPSGRLLASGGEANEIALWDTRTWKRRATFSGAGGRITPLAFSPDGKELAVCASARPPGHKKALQLWNVGQVLADQPAGTPADPGLLVSAGSRGADRGEAIAVDRRGDIYVTGALSGTVTVGYGPDARRLTSAGKSDVFVARYTAAGRLRWAQLMGGLEDDRGTAIALDAGGNVYVGGTSGGSDPWLPSSSPAPVAPAAQQTAFIVKLDSSGRRIWGHVLSGPGTSELHSLAVTPEGMVYAAGNFLGAVDFDPRGKGHSAKAGETNAFVLSLDAQGRFSWMQLLGRVGASAAHGVAVDRAGNALVTGRFRGSLSSHTGSVVWSTGNWDAFVAKLDRGGVLAWVRRLGGPGPEAGYGIAVGPSGHVYITGEAAGESEFDSPDPLENGDMAQQSQLPAPVGGPGSTRVINQVQTKDGILYALDATNRAWRKAPGHHAWAPATDKPIKALFQLGNGEIYMLEQGGNFLRQLPARGDWTLENKGAAAVVSMVQSADDGSIYWLTADCRIWLARPSGGPPVEPFAEHAFSSLVQSPRGRPHLLRSDGVLLRLDPDGPKTVGHANRVISLRQAADGTLYALDEKGTALLSKSGSDDHWEIADSKSARELWQSHHSGRTAPRLSARAGGTDAFLAKLTPDGDPVWIRSVGGHGMDSGHEVAVDSSEHVYLGGTFAGTAGLDATPGLPQIVGKGACEGLVAKFTGDGDVVWLRSLGGPGSSQVYGLSVDTWGHVYATGAFEGRIDFECGLRPVSLTSAGDTDLFLCRLLPQPVPVATFELQTDVAALAFAPDGQSLALGCKDHVVRLWRPKRTLDMPRPMTHAPDEAWAVAFSPDGKMLASGGDNSTSAHNLKVWDSTSGTLRWTAAAHAALVSCVAFSPDGRLLASGGYDNVVKLWDPTSGRELAAFTAHTGALRCVAFSPDGRFLASGGKDKVVHLWDIAAGHLVRTLDGHLDQVRAVAFSSDGRNVVTSEDEQWVRFWDVASGRELRRFMDTSPVLCAAYSPDGRGLAWGMEDGHLRWQDLGTGQVRTFAGKHAGEIRRLAFTPDGRRIATGGADGKVRLWDTEAGSELLTLSAGSQPINCVVFSPAGDCLASASHAGAIRVWRAVKNE